MDLPNDISFFAIINNKQKGPFNIHELKTLNISPKTKVWHQGMTYWENAENIPQLRSIFNPTASNNAIPPDVEKALNEGKRLLAIKFYKEATGCTLKEAKDYINQISPESIVNKWITGCSIIIFMIFLLGLTITILHYFGAM